VTGLRAAQKEMTRKLLLSTALELFETKGYGSTTIDDIATAAGTTRVTFYAYFPSRSDLVRALIGELNEILERIESPRHGSTANDLVATVREVTTVGDSLLVLLRVHALTVDGDVGALVRPTGRVVA
jgi:AcrR family transcriptional regulator